MRTGRLTARAVTAAAAGPSIRRARVAGIAAGLASLGMTYHRFLRPRMLRWGISEEEAGLPLPGDERVPDPYPGNNSTRAITIDAAPETVWPWIVQIGHNRGGWYTHEWVERLLGIRYAEGHSATRIHPQFQQLRIGDRIPYSPFNSIPVVALEPGRYLIIGNTVAWVLQDLGDGRTWLIVRTRGYGWIRSLFRKIPVLREIGAAIDYVIGEPLHHYMEKGMCLGIAERAEAQSSPAAQRRRRSAPPSIRTQDRATRYAVSR